MKCRKVISLLEHFKISKLLKISVACIHIQNYCFSSKATHLQFSTLSSEIEFKYRAFYQLYSSQALLNFCQAEYTSSPHVLFKDERGDQIIFKLLYRDKLLFYFNVVLFLLFRNNLLDNLF